MAIWAAILPSRTCCCSASGNSSTNARRRATQAVLAIETPRQSFDRTAQPAFHLRQQPALFQRGLRLAHPQRALQHQRFGFAHRPHDGLHRVAPQLLERGNAFVAVYDQIAARVFDDDDGRLLPGVSQRGQQAALARRVANPEALQAAVELMKLQLRHRIEVQYAPPRIWSFPG